MRRAFSTAPLAFGLCLALAEPSARAADPEAGLAIDRLDRQGVGSRFYATDTLALREPWRPAFGVQSGYTYRAFSIVLGDGSRSTLVRNLWTAEASGEVVIAGGLRLGLSMPLAVYVDGRDTLVGTSAIVAPTGPAAGDLRIAGDVYAYGEAGAPLSLAVGVAAYLPTGARDSFMGDGTPRVHPRVLLTGKSRALVWGVRAGYMLRPHEEVLGAVELGSEVLLGGSLGLSRGPLTVGPEVLASTVVSSNGGPLTKETTPVETLLSAHLGVSPALVLGAAIGTRITDGLGAPVFRGVASLEYVPVPRPPPSHDRDLVPDESWSPRPASAPAPGTTPLTPRSSPAPTTLDPCERVDSPDCGRAPPTPPPEPPPPSMRTWGG